MREIREYVEFTGGCELEGKLEEKQVAILIDGDNVSHKYIENIIREAEQEGNIKIRRLYGSVSNLSTKAWYSDMPLWGITPMLQIDYIAGKGKSVADQALTIDAMEMIYTTHVDVVFLISSDSDFTNLVYKLREHEIKVIGMGETKTKMALVRACDEFRLLDVIYGRNESLEKENANENEDPVDIPSIDTVIQIICDYAVDEWKNLSVVGNYLRQQIPGFDSRNYGYEKLKLLVERYKDRIDIKDEQPRPGLPTVCYIKLKKAPPRNTQKHAVH